jgi:hypothetical protein
MVPKSPEAEAAAAVEAVAPAAEVAVALDDEDRLHADATSSATMDITTARFAPRPFLSIALPRSVS